MAKKWTHEMFVDFVSNKTNGEFEVRSQYIDNFTKIKLYHNECKREFLIIPANFKRRLRCAPCNIKKKKTTESFKKELKELVGNEYIFQNEYVNAKTKVSLLHTKCNKIWNATPDDILNGGNRCGYCSPTFQNTEKFRETVTEIAGDEYILLSEYENKSTPLKFFHISCGRTFERKPEHFIAGCFCSHCGLENRSKENHYRYNPKLSYEERQRRDMFNGQLKKWRNEVYERDDYTCDICRTHGGRLNAHHLDSWDSFKSSRFSVDNGVTLCVDCHTGFHKTYGYGNNTKIQYIKFRASQ